jgi:ABC-type transporter Mla MlaB component
VVTLETVGELYRVCASRVEKESITLDWQAVSELDAGALALLVAGQREALRSGHTLRHINMPETLRKFAQLYGVDGLIAA